MQQLLGMYFYTWQFELTYGADYTFSSLHYPHKLCWHNYWVILDFPLAVAYNYVTPPKLGYIRWYPYHDGIDDSWYNQDTQEISFYTWSGGSKLVKCVYNH